MRHEGGLRLGETKEDDGGMVDAKAFLERANRATPFADEAASDPHQAFLLRIALQHGITRVDQCVSGASLILAEGLVEGVEPANQAIGVLLQTLVETAGEVIVEPAETAIQSVDRMAKWKP